MLCSLALRCHMHEWAIVSQPGKAVSLHGPQCGLGLQGASLRCQCSKTSGWSVTSDTPCPAAKRLAEQPIPHVTATRLSRSSKLTLLPLTHTHPRLNSAGPTLEALPVHNAGAGLIILALGDPHLLECGQAGQDGTPDPDAVLALWARHDLRAHMPA